MPSPADLAHPEVLAWLPWLGALALLHLGLLLQQWWWQRRQFGAAALKRFGPGFSLPRVLLKWALWAGAAWELLMALAVPLGPPQKIEGHQYGADVIFCLDVSGSMLAQDVQPDRLQVAKQVLQGILDSMDGDRVGLVAFAGGAVVACPLTTDYDTASLFLDKLDGGSVPRDGTDLASALAMALDGFGTAGDRGRLIVLASDGEDTVDSDALAQARRAGSQGVAVDCVGVGTTRGAYLPGQRDFFGRVYAKMWHGRPVLSRLDPEALKAIARASGGEFLRADSSDSVPRVVARIARLKKGLGKAPDRYVRDPLFQAPLLWALALLLAESLLSLRARGWARVFGALWKRLGRHWRPGRALAVALGLLCLATAARADLAIDAGRTAYNQGNAAYRAGDFAAAADAYRRAAQAPELSEAAQYNLGNALFRQGDYRGAIAAYDGALKLDSQDGNAQYNRALAEQMLQSRRKKPKKKKPKKKKNKKGNKKKRGNGGSGGNQPQPGNQQGQGQPQQQPGNQQGQGQPQPQPGNQQGQGQPQQQPGNQQGQGQSGQQPGNQQGGSQPQNQPGPNPGPRLSRDQIEAILNRLRLDQQRYAGAFNPLKHYGGPQKPQDPMLQMLQQFTGVPMGQPTPPPKQDPNYKDW